MAQVSSTGINCVTFPTPRKPDGGVTVSNTGTLSYVVPGEVGEMSQMTISPLHGITDLAAM